MGMQKENVPIIIRGYMENEIREKGFSGFSGNQLKIFAIIAMTMDHLAATIWPGYDNKAWWLLCIHLIGRLAAPTMWFMVAEGYHYTRNFRKYLQRLFIFAVLAHFAYNFCFGISPIPFRGSVLNQTSVIWPLFLAAIGLYIYDDEKRSFPLKNWQKTAILLVLCLLAFPSDWSCFPVLCTLHIYQNRGNLRKQVLGMVAYISMYVIVWCLCIDVVYGLIQFGIIIVWPFMHFYNGTRGKARWMKWFFYVFYVGHLVLCGILRLILHSNVTTIVGG